MTREQAKKKLIDLGVAEPTEEQVTKYLDTVSEETKSEKSRYDRLKAENDQLKADSERLEELQKKIDEAENEKLSELEKLTKDLEKSNQRVAELERLDAIRTQRTSAADKFKITSEQASKVIKDDGTFDMELLGQIISEKENAAALAKEQEIANASSNPNGQAGNENDEDGKSKAVKLVERNFQNKTANNDILSHYKNGGN